MLNEGEMDFFLCKSNSQASILAYISTFHNITVLHRKKIHGDSIFFHGRVGNLSLCPIGHLANNIIFSRRME